MAPPPPRPLTPRVSSRAWADPPVRFWWLAAAALVLAGLGLGFGGWRQWRREGWLVRNGTPVVATVRQANTEIIPRKQPGNSTVRLAFDWQGHEAEVVGVLDGRRPDDLVSVKDEIPLRIDPNDPDAWTARIQPPPLGEALVGGGIVLLLAIVPAVPALFLRRRVLRAWRDGEAVEAVVLGHHQTALAPRSRAVRCALPGDADGRVFTVYVPAGLTSGMTETLPVLVPTRGRPLAAAWFE